MQRTLFKLALFALLFFAAFSPALAQAQQQTSDNGPLSDPPKLAFKLILRTRQPVFASGSTITVEAACVSLPLASAEWQTHWSNACAKLELKFEQARVGGFWGGMNTDWIENRLHLCRLPQGEEYEASSGPGLYSKPEWHLITISPQKLEGLRGLVLISAHAVLRRGEERVDEEAASLVTAITSEEDDGTESDLSLDIQRDGAAVQSGDGTKTNRLTDELLQSSTPSALRMAVRLFENDDRTRALWGLIEDSPHRQLALELMQARLLDPNFVPDYSLLVELTGMRVRSGHPEEFQAAGQQPYPESSTSLEAQAVEYFDSLVDSLVGSTHGRGSTRETAIASIIASVAELDQCPLGTYGLSARRAAELRVRLLGN